MATVTVPTTSTLPVAGGDIIAAPLNGWITNLRTFIESNNIDENNVDYTNSDGIVVMGQAQTITGLKTFENTSAAAGGVRTAAIFAIDPASGTPTDGDGVELLFNADDDEGNVATIGEIEVIMTDTDNGDEDSEIKIKALVEGSAAEFMVAGTPADGAGRVVFNDGSADIDFRIETNNIANGFVVDAGLDTFAFGAAGADDKFVTISPPAASHTATTDTYALHITAGGAQTIPSGTTALVASVAIEEPNITATGTVTNAATLYIKNAPTEGGSNYSLWVDDGAVKLDSTLAVVGVGTFTAQSVHTGGIQSGSNIVSDTDSTDDLGTTSVRWANVYTDAVGDSGQTLGVKATTLSFDAASTIDTSGNNALSLDAGSAVLTLDGGTLESDASTFSFDAAATIDTSGNNALTLDAGSAVLTLDGGTLESDATTLSFDGAASIDTSGNNALSLDAGSAVLTLDGGTLESDASTFSFDAAASIDTSGNNALSLDAGSAVLTLDGGTIESDASTFSFDAAATIDTSGNNNLTLSAGTGTLVATAGDMTLFDDNNNADVSLSLGTSATEALVVQALNGGSNKTLEELRFTTKTASGTANHGKITFHIDEEEIGTIDDGGIDLASGKTFAVNGSDLPTSSGDFSGPGSSTDNAIVRFDGTGGKTGQTSSVLIDDSNNVSGIGTLAAGATTISGDTVVANGYGLIVGNTAQVATNTLTGEAQIQGTAASDSLLSISRYSADASSPLLHFAKSRNATIGNVTGAVQSGDVLGNIIFCGSDGTDFNTPAANIGAVVSGSVSGDTVPGALIFGTNDTERMRIDPSGRLGVHNASPSTVDGNTDVIVVGDGNANADVILYSPTSGNGVLGWTDTADTTNQGYIQYEHDSVNALKFGTAATERMRIDSTGRVTMVGVGGDGTEMLVYTNSGGTNPNGLRLHFSGVTSGDTTDHFVNCTDGGATRCEIRSNGDLANANNSYGSSSDLKIKQDITDGRSYWADFKNLQYKKYRLKQAVEVDANATYQLGLIAQDVETIWPSVVDETPDKERRTVAVLDEDGNATYKPNLDDDGNRVAVMEDVDVDLGTTTKSLKYSIIHGPIMGSVVQELQTRLEAAEAKIAALEAA